MGICRNVGSGNGDDQEVDDGWLFSYQWKGYNVAEYLRDLHVRRAAQSCASEIQRRSLQA